VNVDQVAQLQQDAVDRWEMVFCVHKLSPEPGRKGLIRMFSRWRSSATS
jgi:hypothetical protein